VSCRVRILVSFVKRASWTLKPSIRLKNPKTVGLNLSPDRPGLQQNRLQSGWEYHPRRHASTTSFRDMLGPRLKPQVFFNGVENLSTACQRPCASRSMNGRSDRYWQVARQQDGHSTVWCSVKRRVKWRSTSDGMHDTFLNSQTASRWCLSAGVMRWKDWANRSQHCTPHCLLQCRRN